MGGSLGEDRSQASTQKGRSGKRNVRFTTAQDEEQSEGSDEEQEEDTSEATPDEEEEEVKTFIEENFQDSSQRLIAKIKGQRSISQVRVIRNMNTVRNLDLSSSMEKFGHVMNTHTAKSSRLYMDGCADTSVLFINKQGFTEVSRTERSVTLVGFKEDLKHPSVVIGSGVAALDRPTGPVLVQINEAPLIYAEGNSLLSTPQSRENSVKIDDVAKRHGGTQRIQAENTIIPLKFHHSLLHAPIRKATAWELDNLPRIHLTSDQVWDPACLNDDTEGNIVYPEDDDVDEDLDEFLRTINYTELDGNVDLSEDQVTATLGWIYGERHISPVKSKQTERDPEQYTSNFGFISPAKVKETFKHTTQLATNVLRLPLRRHFKSRNPQLNRPRIREETSTDTIFSSVKGIGGETCAQVFCRKKSLKGNVYGMATESQGDEALNQFIAEQGAPYHMRSDNAQMEISKKWKETYRTYNISSSTSEPHHPHGRTQLRGVSKSTRKAQTEFLTGLVLLAASGSMLCSFGLVS